MAKQARPVTFSSCFGKFIKFISTIVGIYCTHRLANSSRPRGAVDDGGALIANHSRKCFCEEVRSKVILRFPGL